MSGIILDNMKILIRLYKTLSFNEKEFLFHLNNAYIYKRWSAISIWYQKTKK